MSAPERPTLVLRFADLGAATYGSLRVVGQPARTVAWVVEESLLLAALAELDGALPEPMSGESVADALRRALSEGYLASPATELTLAYRLGVLLLSDAAWQLVLEHVASPRAVLFVSPSARLGRVPWGLLALPKVRPEEAHLVKARAAANGHVGPRPAVVPWPGGDTDTLTEGQRLIEFVDVLMAVPPNIVHGRRTAPGASRGAGGPALLVIDPRVPNQRANSALGSVLGRPGAATPLAQYFARRLRDAEVRPAVTDVIELFRRTDADRKWLADMLSDGPDRLMFVGHATSGDRGRADQAALYLADEQPLTAADIMALRLTMPPRVALLACASGGDYRFDEATGLVAAIVLGGAELVTATLWSLPTTAGYREFVDAPADDPMADLIIGVDDAHLAAEAGTAVNRWQRARLRSWRDGDRSASPVYWAALVTFAVDGAR